MQRQGLNEPWLAGWQASFQLPSPVPPPVQLLQQSRGKDQQRVGGHDVELPWVPPHNYLLLLIRNSYVDDGFVGVELVLVEELPRLSIQMEDLPHDLLPTLDEHLSTTSETMFDLRTPGGTLPVIEKFG